MKVLGSSVGVQQLDTSFANTIGEGSVSDSESSEDDNERNVFKTDMPSDANTDILVNKMCNLFVSDDQSNDCDKTSPDENRLDKVKDDEDVLISRSPTRVNRENSSLQLYDQPYSLANRRRSQLQNGGHIISMNHQSTDWLSELQTNSTPVFNISSFNVFNVEDLEAISKFPTLQLNYNTNMALPYPTTSNITGFNDELYKMSEPSTSVCHKEANQVLSVQTTMVKSPQKSVVNSKYEGESSNLFIPELGSISREELEFIENALKKDVALQGVTDSLVTSCAESMGTKSSEYDNNLEGHANEQWSEDSTYGSLNTSPLNVWSPDNLMDSPEILNIPTAPVNDLNVLSPKHKTKEPVESTAKNQQYDNVYKTSTNLMKRYIPVLSDKNQNTKPVSTFPCQKPMDKQIKPLGVIVYDNPTSASNRILAEIKQSKNSAEFYKIQYLKVCLNMNCPEKLKKALFQLLSSEQPLDSKMTLIVYALLTFVLKTRKEEFMPILSCKYEGKSSLHYACLLHKDSPLIARYIVEVMVELGRNVDETYLDEDGNTIIHILASKGDSHVKVLAELLQVKQNQTYVFDKNCKNKHLLTPLHLAVINHSEENPSFSTIKHLIDHFAEMTEDILGRTPLHYSVLSRSEPSIVRRLLPINSSKIINIQDCKGNTALHLIYRNTSVTLEKRQEIISNLLKNKANTKITNSLGEMPHHVMVGDKHEEYATVYL
uniref:Uncharacterized protein n=1 Tax=Clastoptera arizonana TaxID=38151 RepID=A0A1B6CPD5_9HEMI